VLAAIRTVKVHEGQLLTQELELRPRHNQDTSKGVMGVHDDSISSTKTRKIQHPLHSLRPKDVSVRRRYMNSIIVLMYRGVGDRTARRTFRKVASINIVLHSSHSGIHDNRINVQCHVRKFYVE